MVSKEPRRKRTRGKGAETALAVAFCPVRLQRYEMPEIMVDDILERLLFCYPESGGFERKMFILGVEGTAIGAMRLPPLLSRFLFSPAGGGCSIASRVFFFPAQKRIMLSRWTGHLFDPIFFYYHKLVLFDLFSALFPFNFFALRPSTL
jgi:hypothetical protein